MAVLKLQAGLYSKNCTAKAIGLGDLQQFSALNTGAFSDL
ncbi:hypothetical protein LX87_05305 [Larkinella arboricola]|uniref:Uncharacterized protein n=1 Tax=Larkinella arboricola TaxID=643671 RepID=A0A327WI76_LARAB|nr:hypothetical protein LX87_05305 [Larkinella arboricola]